MLDQITPVILTWNEEINIGRTLSALWWAKDIVIVDSQSIDRTIDIAQTFPQVRVFKRQFSSHTEQWNFAVHQTGIVSEWVLALDADYFCTQELIAELTTLKPNSEIVAYVAHFVFCIFGKPLKSSLLPPNSVLYRRDKAQYIQDGHTQKLKINGGKVFLKSSIWHDDRKPLSAWLAAQVQYMRLESQKIINTPFASLDWPDRMRKLVVVAPLMFFLYSGLVKGLFFQGRIGWYYIFQRVVAEIILSLSIIERKACLTQQKGSGK